jgi:hypothetical protein
MLAMSDPEVHGDSALPPLDPPLPDKVTEPLDKCLPKQIQAPVDAGELTESLWGKALQCTIWHDGQSQAYKLEGSMPLGTAHGWLPNSCDPKSQGSIIPEQVMVVPKVTIHVCQVWKPIVNKGGCTCPNHDPIQVPPHQTWTPV